MNEFSDISDYIWKAPNFIEQETKLEKRKLEAYFPLTGDADKDAFAISLRAIRWEHESRKLYELFPQLLAVGNLYACLSVFEAYCLRLANLIERRSQHQVRTTGGRGIQKIFKFFSTAGVQHFKTDYALEMEAALKIRNCLIHSEGLLSWAQEASLRRIIGSGRFLSIEHLERRKRLGTPLDEVTIVTSELGDKITISNKYPHLLATYARWYLFDSAKKASEIYGVSSGCMIRDAEI
jgi:hypothetical protein